MIKKIFAPLLAVAFLASFSVTLAGCNTMEGAGKDVSAAGKEVKEEAREHKKY